MLLTIRTCPGLQSPLVVRVVATAAFVLLALLAKGAILAFYLRERPVVPEAVGTI
jgi:hypothetical protein